MRLFWFEASEALKQKQPIHPVTRTSPACTQPLYICHGRYVQLLCVLRAKLQSGGYQRGGHQANRGPFLKMVKRASKD